MKRAKDQHMFSYSRFYLMKCFLAGLLSLATLQAAGSGQRLPEKDAVRDSDGLPPLTAFGSRSAAAALQKSSAIEDRAGGTHNVSNIGLFFENRGKLYPRRLTDGPSGEFPINSGRHYIYRVNPMVAVAADPASGRKVNVIQGRFTENEEWEAAAGYRNPALAQVAMSDNPNTWPLGGWPLQQDGDARIFSDQDSYCAYSDSSNTVEVLGLQLLQSGYAFGISLAEDLLFFRYDLVNRSARSYDSVYFALYADIDIGNISGGDPEYADDLIDYVPEKDFVYFSDADGFSAEWGGATGLFGLTFLETPDSLGITDMHWNLYYDDLDDDSLQFAVLSSRRSYVPANYDPARYFHPGSAGSDRIDDPATLDPAGEDVLVNVSSGPYSLAPGDTLTFISAFVAGISESDLMSNLQTAFDVYARDFQLPKPPLTPTLSARPGDGAVTLFWDQSALHSLDAFSGEQDFEGFRLYRSLDRGITWDQIDRNIDPSAGVKARPLAQFDRINGIGEDSGLQFSYTDRNLINGIEYWYSLTAYDRGDSTVESLESPVGRSLDALNTVLAIPRSEAAAYSPASASSAVYTGRGQSNALLQVTPFDTVIPAGRSYSADFLYLARNDRGNAGTLAELQISDSSLTRHYSYAFEFIEDDKIRFMNRTLGTTLREYPYRNGVNYNLGDGLKISFTDSAGGIAPEIGDVIAVDFCLRLTRDDGLPVLPTVTFAEDRSYSCSDSLLISFSSPLPIVSLLNPADHPSTLSAAVSDEESLLDTVYSLIVSDSYEASVMLTIYTHLDETLLEEVIFDSLSSGELFSFNGIEASLDFDSPPPAGTLYSLETLRPRRPSILDAWSFTVSGGSTDMSALPSALSAVRVVPNPYVVSSIWEPEFGELRKEPLRKLQFTHLPAACTIHIFTLAGDLLKTLEHNDPSGTAVWDMRAAGGREITAGIYVFVVESGSETHMNRFAVIK